MIFSVVSFVEYEERKGNVQFIDLFLFLIGIQFLGFGLAGKFDVDQRESFCCDNLNIVLGILRRFLVWPSSEVWPSNFPSIALLRVLHLNEKAANVKAFGVQKKLNVWEKLISNQLLFFVVVMIIQFVFYWFPGYIMPVLGTFSWICMIKTE